MNEASLAFLFILLAALILVSAFFSSSETAMMTLNRYRLRHLSGSGNRGAMRSSRLLERPDRLISIILIGNNLVNILASAIATVIAIRLLGDAGIAVATLLLTLTLLVFAEITPKTIAALYPERVAFPFSIILLPLLRVFYPVVWLINTVTNSLLRLLGVDPSKPGDDTALDTNELRTIVNEAGQLIPGQHQRMLLNILDLEQVSVEDIMIPRNEVYGLDLDDDDATLIRQLRDSAYSRLPVFREDINNIVGLFHIRSACRVIGSDGRLLRKKLEQEIGEAYFVPESTPLHTQLFNFQKQKRRIGLVVDEYGEVQGLVTLEDILEEIVGEFTSNLAEEEDDIQFQEDGSLLIDGTATIRDINRTLDWQLPTDGPKTLNGLLLEHLESFPDGPVGLRLGRYRFEITGLEGKLISSARAWEGAVS